VRPRTRTPLAPTPALAFRCRRARSTPSRTAGITSARTPGPQQSTPRPISPPGETEQTRSPQALPDRCSRTHAHADFSLGDSMIRQATRQEDLGACYTAPRTTSPCARAGKMARNTANPRLPCNRPLFAAVRTTTPAQVVHPRTRVPPAPTPALVFSSPACTIETITHSRNHERPHAGTAAELASADQSAQ
jgi:hypothetical protein